MQDYLKQLNPVQKEAVISTEGPSLVIAGAGSGKTRVLTYRIAHLLATGAPPSKILALTFTNKAAREMKQRIGLIVGNDVSQRLWMGTFHSIFARILRIESKYLNYSSNFSIYDTADSKSLIKSILNEMKINSKDYRLNLVLSRISSAKNDLVLPGAYSVDHRRLTNDKYLKVPLIYEIYQRYIKACRQADAMDFDDLLLNTNLLFRDFPEVLAKYQSAFNYILVDEYQDTNFAQYLIINNLASKHQNICVVGDDAQSIYSFRGAKIENILNFRNAYPGYKLFKLEENYRSTQTIVNAANSVISNNKKQISKRIYSRKDEGEKIRIFSAISDMEEGLIVVNDLVAKQLASRSSYDEFAVLYRTNAQSRIIEEALRKRNVPYRIYGGLSFYQRKEIKDLLAYMRLSVNAKDGEALKRIINYPARGIGKVTLAKLEHFAASNDVSIWEILTHPNLSKAGFNSGTLRRLQEFTTLISSFQTLVENMDAYDLAIEIAGRSGLLKEFHQDQSHEGRTRIENIDELLNGVKEFTELKMEAGEPAGLSHFLEEVSLLTDQDQQQSDDIEKVTLMTIHSAKGLEFPYVYVVGVEEELFPSSMSSGSEAELEEERRLFYVALTRAEREVTLSYARNRYRYGSMTFSGPSRFLREIDDQYISSESLMLSKLDRYSKVGQQNMDKAFKFVPRESISRKPSFNFKNREKSAESYEQKPSVDIPELKIGALVEHRRFGVGKVLSLEGNAPNTKARVDFNNAGEKQLLLKFAKLKILS